MSGPVAKPVEGNLPLRGDLAHIALAGRYFVPHYAVPQPRIIATGGTMLRAAPREDADALRPLDGGFSFDVLDLQGDWAWGTCHGLDGPCGYVALARLEPLA